MVTEVLLRLPSRSAVRFRAVCRSDYKAAPAPSKLLHFAPTARFDATAVYSHSLSSSGPRDVGGDQPLFTLDLARGNGLDVLTPAPCRGLTLLHDALARALYLCNAATKTVTRLPPFPDAPALRPSTTGLGFDARTGKHKVVRLINETLHDEEPIRCEVYTPGGGGYTDRWRPAAGALPLVLHEFAISAVLHAEENRLPPVFANGSLHWLIRPYLEFASPEAAIVSFSVTEETFRCVRSPPLRASDCEQHHPFPLPPELDLPFLPCAPEANLVEMDDQLCMARDLRKNPYGSNLEIWRLLDYSSGDWLLNHRIDLSGHVARELREPQTVRVLGFIGDCRSGKKKKIIIATCKHMVHEKFEKKVHTYDLGSEALETILSVTVNETHASSVRDRPPRSRFSLFQESFAPVHRTDEEIAWSSAMAKAIKEILLRLPAKSVMQSKLICKQWLKLIQE